MVRGSRDASVWIACAWLVACSGGTGDGSAPSVVVEYPRGGELGVSATSAIRIAFSEPMDPASGTLVVGGVRHPVSAGSWDAGGRVFTFVPSAPFASGAEVEVTVEGDFADLDGHALDTARTFVFQVGSLAIAGPTVTSSTPADGAEAIPVDVGRVVVRFSQAMDTSRGSAVLFGGASAGAITWVSPTEASIAITTLSEGGVYSLSLDGFRSSAGVALDLGTNLGNGRIDFTAGEDSVGPIVVASTPAEGSTNVEANRLRRITLTFDEPMSIDHGAASLSGYEDPDTGSTDPLTLALTWSVDGHVATLTLPSQVHLPYESAYSVTLEGFEDVHGNAFQAAATLIDGRLDFSAGVDTVPPQALASTPIADGDTGVAVDHDDFVQWNLNVTFDEPIDVSDVTAVLEHEDGDVALNVYGADGGTRLQLNAVRAPSDYEGAYRIVLAGVRDHAGNAMATTGYLGDGFLDFTLEEDVYPPFVDEVTGIAEGSGSVSTQWTRFVTFALSEPVDVTRATASLVRVDASGEVELEDLTPSMEWSNDWEDRPTLQVSFEGSLLADGNRYRILLSGFEDRGGNALDPVPTLGDGALDFSVGAPRVVSSSPTPGSRIYPWEWYASSDPLRPGVRTRQTFPLRFGEPMDPAIRSVTLVDETSGEETSLDGSWSFAGNESELTIVALETVEPEVIYRLEFGSLRGMDGLQVDAGSGYFPGATLRFGTTPSDGRLDHTCGHVLYDVCHEEVASPTMGFLAPSTSQGHFQYALELGPDGNGGFTGYSMLEAPGDGARLLLYLREPATVAVIDATNQYQVPIVFERVPAACPEVTTRVSSACAQLGEPGLTYVARIPLPSVESYYYADWHSSVSTLHFVAERDDGQF